jgi:hypothetical protein
MDTVHFVFLTLNPYMKLHIVGTANRSLRRAQAEWNIESAGGGNDEVWNRCAQPFFKNNNDRIPYFDIRYSLFDIRYSLFQSFFLIKLAVSHASGWAEPLNLS